MARLGCIWAVAILALLTMFALSSCATDWRCQFIYDETSKRRLSCDARNGDHIEVPNPASEDSPEEEIDPYMWD